MHPTIARSTLAALLFACAASLFGQDEPSAREQAQNYFESDEARKAVATLLEAAQRDPADRVIGTMLYTAIRDHVWHLPQTFPIKNDAEVRALAFSPDGAWLASGSASGEILLSKTEPLDEEEAKAQQVAFRHDSAIAGLAFTRNGQRLAAVSRQGSAQVWQLADKRPVFTAPKPAAAVTAFAAADGADFIAVGLENGAIQVFDIAGGKLAAEFLQPGGAVRALAFSRSGEKLAAATGDRAAHVWVVSTGKLWGKGVVHEAALRAVDVSSDERYVVSASEDGVAWLSDPGAGVAVMPKMACGAAVKKAVVSPDGSMIATVLDDSSILFWDALTGTRLGFTVRENAAFNDFAWTRSGLRSATASEDGHASLWTMRDGNRRGETMPHEAPVRVLALSLDSKLLATGCADGLTRIWRTDGGMPLPTVRFHVGRARAAFYSLDGEHLVTTSEDHTALHWRSGEVRPFGPALKHKGKVTCAVFDSGATRILTCDDTGIAQLWDAETGLAEGAAYKHKAPVNWVDFHPDGQRLVTSAGAAATVWSVADRTKPLATLTHAGKAKSEIKCARFSPDGKWLATASTDGTARIWDAATYRAPGVILDRKFPVLCVRFSPDSSRLVVAGEDGQAAVYDTGTWQVVGVPVLATGPVFSAALTEDNQFMVISSLLLDAVQFFEISSGRPLGNGLAIPSQATCVDYLVTDKVVAVACDDGTVLAVETPFVSQAVPAWMSGFIDRLIGLRKTGPDQFERVNSNLEELRSFVSGAARAANADFSKLVRWKMSPGTNRNGMPRFTSTLAGNIERRVEERSVNSLFECHEAVSGDPLILAAISLYLPNARQGEFIADLVLKMEDASPVARCFAASTLIRIGRSTEAQAIVTKALADAPDDAGVVRRVAKVHARLLNKTRAIELFEKAVALDPGDPQTRRDYGWALYAFHMPVEAAVQFNRAQDIVGDMVDDLIAGLCLCASAQKNDKEARSNFVRLVALNPDWKSPAYISGQRGWNNQELTELERVRGRIFTSKKP